MSITIENDGQHIKDVISRVPCKRHKVELEEACFISISGTEDVLLGVCNWRAKKAGFNGKISDEAIRKKSPIRGRQ